MQRESGHRRRPARGRGRHQPPFRSRSFHDVVEIVNPFNWSDNYPEFFLSMDPCDAPERTDGWFRVLETVGFSGLDGLELRTNLKYYPKLD